jgi:pimeloyl-ACP methyl ester carboxylesterase
LSKTHLITVPGERKIAVESYGDPGGAPIFFFHGWPSSRFQGKLGDETARDLGIHFLSVDRPGVGGSDLHIGRALAEWPSVIAALADHFKSDTFRVLGVSGGGPYALVSAWALPDRVRAAAVVSGAPPLAGRANVSNLMPVYQLLLGMYRHRPEIVRWLFRLGKPVITIRPPQWLWRQLLRAVPACDRAGFSDPGVFDRAWQGYHGAWIGHPDGVFYDARIYAEPWGFDLGEIRVRTCFWHGREDRNFHWQLAEEMAASIPDSRIQIMDGEGHYSLIIRHHREVLLDLMSGESKG